MTTIGVTAVDFHPEQSRMNLPQKRRAAGRTGVIEMDLMNIIRRMHLLQKLLPREIANYTGVPCNIVTRHLATDTVELNLPTPERPSRIALPYSWRSDLRPMPVSHVAGDWAPDIFTLVSSLGEALQPGWAVLLRA